MDSVALVEGLALTARSAARTLSTATGAERKAALEAIAQALEARSAEILAASKSSASGAPLQKVDTQVVDLGGPTPTNSKPDDDSNKIDTTKAAKSAAAPTTKSSDASADTQLELGGGKKTMKEDEQVEDEVIVEDKIDVSEDINALFADDATISEEFKTKDEKNEYDHTYKIYNKKK